MQENDNDALAKAALMHVNAVFHPATHLRISFGCCFKQICRNLAESHRQGVLDSKVTGAANARLAAWAALGSPQKGD